MNAAGETIRVAGIELSTAGIKPVVGNLATLVKTEEISEIIVRYGFLSAHPFIQLVVGAGLSLLPIYVVVRLLFWLSSGGTIHEGEIMLIATGIIGLWLFIDALSRGHYLIVKTTRGKRKMCLTKKTPVHVIMILCQQLHDRKFKVRLESPFNRHLPTGPFSPV